MSGANWKLVGMPMISPGYGGAVFDDAQYCTFAAKYVPHCRPTEPHGGQRGEGDRAQIRTLRDQVAVLVSGVVGRVPCTKRPKAARQ